MTKAAGGCLVDHSAAPMRRDLVEEDHEREAEGMSFDWAVGLNRLGGVEVLPAAGLVAGWKCTIAATQELGDDRP